MSDRQLQGVGSRESNISKMSLKGVGGRLEIVLEAVGRGQGK